MAGRLTVAALANQINHAAVDYDVGALQQYRRELHGKGPKSNMLITATTTFQARPEPYAYHFGGRTELQFNIGMELRGDKHWWRHGVAFSFEPSQTLPNPPEELCIKVDRFNSWVRGNSGLLHGFKMWDWESARGNSSDRAPEVIADALRQNGVFVFLGKRVPEEEVNVNRILQDFDRLLPLYRYVESGEKSRASRKAETSRRSRLSRTR